MRAQNAGVDLLLAVLHGFDDRNANAGPDVAHQIENTGRVPHAVEGNRIVRGGRQGNKHQAQRGALHHQRPPEIPETSHQGEPRQLEHGDCARHETDAQKFPGIHFRSQIPDKRHGNERGHAARHIGDTGTGGREAQDLLHEQRKQDGTAVEHQSYRHHQRSADGERAVTENSEIHDGVSGLQFPNNQARQTEDRQDGEDGDKLRPEPVILLAFVEHDLQRSNAQDQ